MNNEVTKMPLNLALFDKEYTILKVCGNEKQKHHLESLGFISGGKVTLLSELHGYYIVMIKGSKVGIDKQMAKKIILLA